MNKMNKMDINTFAKFTLKELKVYCKDNNIKGVSKLNKKNLLEKITTNINIESTTQNNEGGIKIEPNIVLDSEESTLNKNNTNILETQDNHTSLKLDNDNIKLYTGDCLTQLKNIPNKSIQLICIDPPYNIGKDTWDTIDNYLNWLLSIIKILETKLKDNGSFFMFHNEMETISELMVAIKKQTKFIFKQMIVWNKRFEGSSKKGFLDGYVVKNDMHNWNKMAEYILFYTFDNSYKLKETRKKMNITQITISKEILSRTGGLTGWYSNLETGKNMPTRDTIKPIEKHLKLKYEDIVPKFNNMKTDHSVWNYDMAKRCSIHITPKPIALLENIIRHTTDEHDIVLDCFAGSGTMGYACINTKRKCILIEKEQKYCNYIISEIKKKYKLISK